MNGTRASVTPVIVGIVLVVLGALIMIVRLVDIDLGWEWLKFVLPVLLLAWGVFKLIRHYFVNVSVLVDRPGKSGLLGGLFWIGVGGVWLLHLLGVLDFWDFFGLYWPVLLVLFGLGKIVDYYRSQGRLQVRFGEIFGVLAIVLIGSLVAVGADAQWHLMPSIDLPTGRVAIDDWFDQSYSFLEEQELDAEGVQSVAVDNLYGDIVVTGSESSRVRVELTKAVLASDEAEAKAVADEVRLTVANQEGILRIGTNRKDVGQKKKLFKSHLKLWVPPAVALRLENQYGDVRVSGATGGCVIRNSYGDVVAENLSGGVDVENKYRQVVLRHVEGEVRVSNDRGPIRAEDGAGALGLTTAYDGITVRRHQGPVTAKTRFGSVTVDKVNGAVELDAPGSEISARDVDGILDLKASHKNVRVTRARKAVMLETSNNRATLERIGGLATIRAAYADVRASDLEGGLKLDGKGTRVTVEDLVGGFEVSTSTRPVRITRFAGGGSVQNEFSEVELRTDRPLAEPVTVSNKNADITVLLPEGSPVMLSAQAPGGSIDSQLEGAKTSEEITVFEAEVGQGGPRLRLQTTYGDIRIRRSARSR